MRLRDKKCGETHDYGFSSGDDGSICVGQDGDLKLPPVLTLSPNFANVLRMFLKR